MKSQKLKDPIWIGRIISLRNNTKFKSQNLKAPILTFDFLLLTFFTFYFHILSPHPQMPLHYPPAHWA